MNESQPERLTRRRGGTEGACEASCRSCVSWLRKGGWLDHEAHQGHEGRRGCSEGVVLFRVRTNWAALAGIGGCWRERQRIAGLRPRPDQRSGSEGKWAHAKTPRRKGGRRTDVVCFLSWRLGVLSEAGVRNDPGRTSGCRCVKLPEAATPPEQRERVRGGSTGESVAPPGAGFTTGCEPTADAVGYCLSVLRT